MSARSHPRYIVSAGSALLPGAALDVALSFLLLGKQYPPHIPAFGIVMALLAFFLRRSNLTVAFNLAHWLSLFLFGWLPIVVLAPLTLLPAFQRAQINLEPHEYFMAGAYILVLLGSWSVCLGFLLKANVPAMRKERGLRCTPISHSVYAGAAAGCVLALLAILQPNSVVVSSPYSQAPSVSIEQDRK